MLLLVSKKKSLIIDSSNSLRSIFTDTRNPCTSCLKQIGDFHRLHRKLCERFKTFEAFGKKFIYFFSPDDNVFIFHPYPCVLSSSIKMDKYDYNIYYKSHHVSLTSSTGIKIWLTAPPQREPCRRRTQNFFVIKQDLLFPVIWPLMSRPKYR